MLTLGMLLAVLAAFSTAIEYGTATSHDPAVLASDGTAIGHNSVVTNSDGTALGLGRD
ncbi:hypothetical protein [Actinomadura macra]|uniref:hypothetical protein n=1 Tax=Actinomadura macra TaxID=46164 RepID=UPI0012F71577|nr:hypothetical protein [Actinomadura macra]